MKKDRICISICSRRFNYNFLKLLDCIYKNSLNKNLKINLLIVFNCSTKIKKFQEKLIKKTLKKIIFKIIYEKKKGISYVRNKCLSYLKYTNFDYYCFLDDDCKIKNNYIINHLKFIKNSNCSIVSGPQFYESNKLFFKVFERNFIQGQKIFWASTNNVFFKKKVLKNNVFFSNKVSRYGFGEDQLFFSKLFRKGEVIKWNHNPVYEISQKRRENLKWFIDRNIKYGLTGLLIDKEIYNFSMAYILNIIKAFYNLFLASVYLFLIPIDLTNNFYKSFAYSLRFFGRSINFVKF